LTHPVRIVGHMGMGRHRPGHRYPENSVPAFRAALALGADGVEFDVHLTADDQVAVHHDYRLGRATALDAVDGTRMVSHLPLAALERVPLAGEVPATIPGLARVIDAVGDATGEIWVELKRQPSARAGHRLVERSLEILTEEPAWPRVVLRSYEHELLTEVRRRREDARVHLLTVARIDHGVHFATRHGLEGISVFHGFLSPELSGLIHRAGLTITAGGEPGEARSQRLLDQGPGRADIDYICTDWVERALTARSTLSARESTSGGGE
jgi:glycerophosphoryl diester phosphodiesterase